MASCEVSGVKKPKINAFLVPESTTVAAPGL